MKKVVINKKYGGFGLSPIAIEYYFNLKGLKSYFYRQTKYKFEDGVEEYKKIKPEECDNRGLVYCYNTDLGDITSTLKGDLFFANNLNREDPFLIKTVEDLGEKANDRFSKLAIVEIPDIEYEIQEYDGYETITSPTVTYG